MISLRSRILSLTVLSLFLAPIGAQAKLVDSVLVNDDGVVMSRGDFIRAAVETLEIPVFSGDDLPYLRVPAALENAVRAAHKKDALQPVFGTDLRLATSIKRGEALQIVYALQELSGVNPQVRYNDVPSGSAVETAVRAAVARGWMTQLGANFFGVGRNLTTGDARTLLKRINGEEDRPSKQESPVETESKNKEGQTYTIKLSDLTSSSTKKSNLPNGSILETIWSLINRDYLFTDKIDSKEIGYSIADAMMKALDDGYSTFLRPQTNKNFQTQIQGEVSGIGAQVEERDGFLTIVAPLRGSPAEKAGLKPGDKITSIDGKSLEGTAFLDAVEMVRGPKGSKVLLTVDRNGTTFPVTITRDAVTVPEIEVKWEGPIAIIHLTQFGNLTDGDIRDVANDVASQYPAGVILDLRNNPGGLLHAAEVVASIFLPKGTVVSQIKSKTDNFDRVTEFNPIISPSTPLVVLVNGGSASASEIVAGALRDAGRAKIVGEKTFGKGTVQEVIQFTDGSSMKLTVAEWLTPKGHKINGQGILPDVEVERKSDRDEQLLKAIELLQ